MDLGQRFDLPPPYIEERATVAKLLASISTRVGNSRLIAAGRRKKQLFLPALLHESVEQKDASGLIQQLREQLRASGQQGPWRKHLLWSIKYYVTHTQATKSGLRFHDPKHLRRFLKPFRDTTKASRWSLRLHLPIWAPPDNDILDKWKRAAGRMEITVAADEKVKQGGGARYGTALLHLRHIQWQERQKALRESGEPGLERVDRYGSRTMGYVLHMLAIVLLDVDQAEELVEQQFP